MNRGFGENFPGHVTRIRFSNRATAATAGQARHLTDASGFEAGADPIETYPSKTRNHCSLASRIVATASDFVGIEKSHQPAPGKELPRQCGLARAVATADDGEGRSHEASSRISYDCVPMNCSIRFPSLLVIATFVALSPLRSDETRDLLLVAGQSNAVGFDAPAAELPADPSDETILFWWRCGDPPPDQHDSLGGGGWTNLCPQPLGQPLTRESAAAAKPPHPDAKRQYGNFAKAGGGFGPEITFARSLAAAAPLPLAVLKVAFSGTSVARDWDPTLQDPDGACYRALVDEYRKAIAAAKSEGITLRPRALVWVQGESDATAEHAPRYEDNLRAMLERLRRDLEAPDLVLLLGVNTRFGNGKNPHMPAVIAAQKAVAEALPDCAYVDTSGAETLPPSHTHFTAAGTLEIGKRYAEALRLEEGSPAR